HGCEHLCKSHLRLRHHPELNLAAHVHRPHHQRRHDQGNVVVTVGENSEVPAPADGLERVTDHCTEAPQEILMLAAFAAEEGNRLRMVAHPYKAVSEIGLPLIPLEVQSNETGSNHSGEKMAHA